MVLPAVGLVANLHPHASRFNGKGIGSHQAERFGKAELNGIYGGQDSHQGHDTECNNENCEDGPQHVCPDGFQGNPEIFEKHGNAHGNRISSINKNIKKLNKLPGIVSA
jgi:hypothetical protein